MKLAEEVKKHYWSEWKTVHHEDELQEVQTYLFKSTGGHKVVARVCYNINLKNGCYAAIYTRWPQETGPGTFLLGTRRLGDSLEGLMEKFVPVMIETKRYFKKLAELE